MVPSDCTLIAVSGIDGAGKTTVATSLVKALGQAGHTAIYSRPAYECNAKILWYCRRRWGDDYAYHPMLPANFYLSVLCLDWLQWLVSLEELPDDCVVCCDRYLPDVLAQAVQYGASIDMVLKLTEEFPRPDLSLFLDIDPKVAVSRIMDRGGTHSLDSRESLTSLAKAYSRAERLTWKLTKVDVGRSLERVLVEVEELSLVAIGDPCDQGTPGGR